MRNDLNLTPFQYHKLIAAGLESPVLLNFQAELRGEDLETPFAEDNWMLILGGPGEETQACTAAMNEIAQGRRGSNHDSSVRLEVSQDFREQVFLIVDMFDERHHQHGVKALFDLDPVLVHVQTEEGVLRVTPCG